jgi:hypothetical protein
VKRASSSELAGRASARRALALRAALWLPALALLAGCPLQTPTFDVISSGLAITVSAGSPLPGQTIMLTASSAMGADLSSATWTSSDATILSLPTNLGSMITATAVKPGLATVTVKAGTVRGAVAITVLASVGEVDLVGPTSLALGGDDPTYTATVTDATGRKINATVTWVASGTVALATTGSNTGPSMRIHATSVGPGAVTAQAGDRSAQIAVNVSATAGQLVITSADGTPVPANLPAGEALTVEASYQVTGEPASDAQWTAEGVCKLLGTSGATLSVQDTGSGACTLTAVAKGMTATAAFQIVSVTGVKIVGDTTPLALGEVRTYTAFGLAGTLETGAAGVMWGSPASLVLTLQPASATVKVMGTEFGTASLVATLPGNVTGMVDLTVAPTAIQLSSAGGHVLPGGSTTVTAKAFGPMNKAGLFASATGVTLTGATGFGSVAPGVLQPDGTVTFALGNAQAASPAVTAAFAGVTSNSLSFTLAQVAAVTIMGPLGPIRIGSGADFVALPVDSTGARIDGDLPATWADATGVYQFPANATVKATGNAVKLGTSSIVVTVQGVSSSPYASPVQPGSVSIAAFSPTSVGVGGMATAMVSILDAGGAPIPNVPLSQVSVAADDASKVSLDAGAAMGTGFLFTATGLAPTSAAGVNVTATWTDGMYPVMSMTVPLVVTGP